MGTDVFSQKVQRAAARHSLGGIHRAELSHEPEDFKLKFARLCNTLKMLRKAEVAVKKYTKKSHSLAKAAKDVGTIIGTNQTTLSNLSTECSHTMGDDALIAALDAKIKLLESTVKERRRLEDIRLLRDHHEQRLAQVTARKEQEKGHDREEAKYAAEMAKWQAKLDYAQREYDELLVELTTALDFIDQETAVNGPWALVSKEMDAFRANASTMLTNTLGMLEGLKPGGFVHDNEEAMLALQAENDKFASERPNPPTFADEDA